MFAVAVEDVGDGAGTAAIVEEAGSGAEDGAAFLAGRVGQAEARGDVGGDVVEVVLPVVTNAAGEGEVRAQAEGVFGEEGEDFFDEDDVAVALLEGVGGGDAGLVVGERREGVGASEEAGVIEAAAADVRDVDAVLQFMAAVGVRDEVGAVEVAFVAEVVGLRAAAGEGSLDDDGGSFGDGADGVGVSGRRGSGVG